MAPAPDPAPQLVQLRQTEAVRVLDHHDRGIGHVHPHLDHGGGGQHFDLPGFELGHDLFLHGRLQASVQKTDAAARENVLG